MPQLNDLSRSLVALDQDSTIIAVVELSQSSWLVGGVLPGIEDQPQKKLEPSAERLLGLLHRCAADRVGQIGAEQESDQRPMPEPRRKVRCRRRTDGAPCADVGIQKLTARRRPERP